jgi:hypothetical protein
MSNIFYRSRQFTRSLRPRIEADELGYIRDLLSSSQAQLFFKLPLFEQRHALNVCQTLVKAGFGNDRELLQAALLHDVGKTDFLNQRHVPLWGKVANVLLRKVGGPALVAKLAQPNPQSWRYIFYLQHQHETRSAQLAQEAASSKRVVALVGGCKSNTQTCHPDSAALALQWADDQN